MDKENPYIVTGVGGVVLARAATFAEILVEHEELERTKGGYLAVHNEDNIDGAPDSPWHAKHGLTEAEGEVLSWLT